ERIELHDTEIDDDGVMRMEHRPDGFVVPAGGELVLEPGGAHVMLLDVDPADLSRLEETELTFEIDAGELVVVAEIRDDVGDPDPDLDGESHGHDP
ncbi:MAG: copper chaperone PCu(A)C, partial [Ilumatobacteraceae bacterium]